MVADGARSRWPRRVGVPLLALKFGVCPDGCKQASVMEVLLPHNRPEGSALAVRFGVSMDW